MPGKKPKALSPRIRDTHKGDYGHVLVIAGSVGMTGAAYLASEAALLSGSGLVTLGIPKSLNLIMEVKLTEVMTLPLDETKKKALSRKSEKKILGFAKKADVAAIGPGLSKEGQTQDLIRRLIERIDRPIVLDADGLNAFARKSGALKKHRRPLVITPHPGEMSRLTGLSIKDIERDRKGIAKAAARRYDCITVLKGAHTIVANPRGEIYINETGNPGMATGGVGDILTGMIASLIGQGLDSFGAAKLASYLHGLAGDLAMRERGEISLRAIDVLDNLPRVLKNL